jgi:hypothetical protein
MKQMAMLRKKWILSKYAHLMPPKQRTKARFQNIFPLIEWIEKIELHWEKIDSTAQQELQFLKDNTAMITDLKLLKTVINKMASILKIKGINHTNLQQCKDLLEEHCTTTTTAHFSQLLQNDWMKYNPIITTEDSTYIASSDIIESYFGKFKQKIKPSGTQAITETTLTMAMWTQNITPAMIETALETTKLKQINQWKNENTIPSLLKKRTSFFTQNCKKKDA